METTFYNNEATAKTIETVLSLFDISDWINIVLLFFTLIGLIFAGKQLRQGKEINRAVFVKELYFTL